MIPKAAEVRLTPEDRSVLEMRVRAPTSEQREVFRARIVLLAAEGRSTRSIAKAVDTMPRTVSLWRGRYAREGLAGLVAMVILVLTRARSCAGAVLLSCGTPGRAPGVLP